LHANETNGVRVGPTTITIAYNRQEIVNNSYHNQQAAKGWASTLSE